MTIKKESSKTIFVESNSFYTLDRGNTSETIVYHSGRNSSIVESASLSIPTYYCQVKPGPIDGIDLGQFHKNQYYFDMKINYADTLGIDRVLTSFPYRYSKGTIVIDSGTFTTADFINSSGFQGGYIFPGIDLILKTYKSGANFSCEKFKLSPQATLPKNTQEAIGAAVYLTILSPLLNFIESQSFEQIIITGGNGKLLSGLIPKSTYSPLLIHNGMKQAVEMMQ